MRYTPVRCTLCEVHAHETLVYERHTYERHAYERHAMLFLSSLHLCTYIPTEAQITNPNLESE
jgi:hypothetical protein